MGEREGKGEAKVYEADEVNKKGGKLRCLLLRRTVFYSQICYEVIEKQKRKTASVTTTYAYRYVKIYKYIICIYNK